MAESFTTVEVVRRTGASFRRVDYWARTGLVTPSVQAAQGSGSQRLYSPSDLWRAAVVTQLLDAGLSLSQVRESLDRIAEDGEVRLGVVRILVDLDALAARLRMDPPARLHLVRA